ncbi:MAG: cysteine desulfurase [Nanoarchaeota archaeon]|nr:cysteine desulfurase [Nanoarchaeota archaeon]
MPKIKAYLDNSATTKVDEKAALAVKDAMLKHYGNPSSLHLFGEEAKELLSKARAVIAKEINAKPSEIIFTSGGTEANNLAVRGIMSASSKKHIVTSAFEHHSVLNLCKQLEKEGFSVTYVNPDREGIISPDKVKEAITADTALVSVMHANNEIGTIQPIEEIANICRARNVLFHTDAVQSFKKIPVNARWVDALSLSSHKIHGPKGVGVLYLRDGVKIKPLVYGGHQENEKRPGTENVPGIMGFAKAAEQKIDVKKIEKLKDYFISKVLKEIPDTMLNGSSTQRLCNNANISFKYIEGEGLLLHLSMKGIAVSTGSACSSTELEPSHVLLAIGLRHEEAHGSIRFTLSKYTTKAELDYTLKELKSVVKTLRKISPIKGGNRNAVSGLPSEIKGKNLGGI